MKAGHESNFITNTFPALEATRIYTMDQYRNATLLEISVIKRSPEDYDQDASRQS